MSMFYRNKISIEGDFGFGSFYACVEHKRMGRVLFCIALILTLSSGQAIVELCIFEAVVTF
jgi:hypothetical protein